MTDRPQIVVASAGASREEAAAMLAAIEQFLRDTAPAPVPVEAPGPTAWKRAALAEGVACQPDLPRPPA